MQIAASLQPGPLLARRYRILEKIGDGGFGTVYKARDLKQSNKPVAIKEINMVALSVEEKIEATASYNREIMLLPHLRHKSLPRIYDHFTDSEHWYIVQEYIEGYTLEEILKALPGKYLPVEEVLDIGIALCDVLGYLHSQEPPIIFRDVKPANIMLTRTGRLYLIDFGIARRYRKGQRRDTVPLGTPGYAAPEQYNKEQTRWQTDIYGLGATLQTLLTGKDPLDLLAGGIPPYLPVSEQLRALIRQMMQKEPNKRPSSLEKVQMDLEQLRSQHPAIEEVADLNVSIGAWGWMLYCACFALLIISVALLFGGRWGQCISLALNSSITMMFCYLIFAAEESSEMLTGETIQAIVWKHLPASLICLVIAAGLTFFLPADRLLELVPTVLGCCLLIYLFAIHQILRSIRGEPASYLTHTRYQVQILRRKRQSP